jgi:hypothetical protein
MPQGQQRQRETRIGGGKVRAVAKLTPEELARVNQERSPSERVGKTPRCGARLSSNTRNHTPEQDEDPTCKQAAGAGTDHVGFGYCKFHGGNTPAGKKAGAREMGRAIIREQKKAFGDSSAPENHLTPEQALLEEVRRSVAMVRWLEERIGQWDIPDFDALADPKRSTGDAALAGLPPLMTETMKGTPMATDVNSWLVLYREERAHMVKVAKLAIDAGIAERMVKVAESQGAMLATAIRAVLQALHLTPHQADRVPFVVPAILRNVVTGEPIPEETRLLIEARPAS